MSDVILKTSMGQLWIQPYGAGYPVYPLACKDTGDLTESEGEISDLIQCLKPTGQREWEVLDDLESPPDLVDFSVDALVRTERDWLERVKCRYALYIHRRDCGLANIFGNYLRAHILTHVKRTSKTHSGLVARGEEAESGLGVEMQAWPPVLEALPKVVDVKGPTTTFVGLRGVYSDTDQICAGCPDPKSPGEVVVAVGDSVLGATPNVYFSYDFGATWAAAAADPGAINDDLAAVIRVPVGKTTIRTIIARYTPAGTQGAIYWSDNDGATAWNTVTIGGAAAGDGPLTGGCLWFVDLRNIFLATAIGHIYKSTNSGLTWTLVENALITVNDYNWIRFSNSKYGIAVGDGGIVALSDTHGQSWYAATAIAAAPNLSSCVRFDKYRMQVTTIAGAGWQSLDGGVTWDAMTMPAEIAGQAAYLSYINDYQGFLAGTDAGADTYLYQTINGGVTWENLLANHAGIAPRMIQAVTPQVGYLPAVNAAAQEQVIRIYESTLD